MIVGPAFSAAFMCVTPRTATSQLLSVLPKRRQLRLGHEAVLIGVEPVEQGRGQFAAVEFTVVVLVVFPDRAAQGFRGARRTTTGHTGPGGCDFGGFVRQGQEGGIGRGFVVLGLHHKERERTGLAVDHELRAVGAAPAVAARDVHDAAEAREGVWRVMRPANRPIAGQGYSENRRCCG